MEWAGDKRGQGMGGKGTADDMGGDRGWHGTGQGMGGKGTGDVTGGNKRPEGMGGLGKREQSRGRGIERERGI